jgi:choice-of-anchor C domain-containing protein
MLRWKMVATAVVSGLLATPASAALNLVSNGSFELGSNPGTFSTLGVGSPGLTDWTIAGGTIDYIGSYWQASDGVRSVDLAGNAPGTISQTISGLTTGMRYLVSFDLAGNPDGPPPIKNVDVTINGSTSGFAFPVGSNTRASMGWQPYSFTFFASGTSTVLSFAASNQAPGFFGAALDNVSVSSAVPEPATWAMMLTGFFGLGLLARRRRRVLLG